MQNIIYVENRTPWKNKPPPNFLKINVSSSDYVCAYSEKKFVRERGKNKNPKKERDKSRDYITSESLLFSTLVSPSDHQQFSSWNLGWWSSHIILPSMDTSVGHVTLKNALLTSMY